MAVMLALPLGAAPGAGASGDVQRETLTIGTQHHEYFLYLPKLPDGVAKAPLLVLLHGSGHDGRSLLDPWIKTAAKEGIVLLAPSAINPAMWQTPQDGPAALLQVTETVRSKYDLDANRVYLFGHSSGAIFALLMSCFSSGTFAATAVHAGALPPATAQQVEGLMRSAQPKTPIQIQVGTEDAFFPLNVVRATEAAFAAHGFPIEVKEIAHHDHNYYGIADAVNREAWSFLKDKRLPADSK